ncbi:MAG: DUF4493 domain-containing protein, partial [Muribaculaceae bacterium]|nr:DUF4493 domain-containing protein [Muribaculaceae bacterium]
MIKKAYILPLIAATCLAASCSKENPFGNDNKGEGKFMKSALAMDIKADALERHNAPSRASKTSDANVDDFQVIFTKAGSAVPVAKFKYGEMPDVVILPEGTYVCSASYGENRMAEWESPYFLGTSSEFDIVPNEITSYIDPIVCELANVKVTVDFDLELRNAMSPDSYVDVKVGDASSLKYALAEADAQKGGFFMHSGETTLVATFHGEIEGVNITETKTLRDVMPGNHYKVTFRLHNGGMGGASGQIDSDINVDASVSVVDVACNVPLGDEPLLDDLERPSEEPETPPTPPVGAAPTITPKAPLTLDGPNNGAEFGIGANPVTIYIHSDSNTGIKELTCDIVSETLNKTQLESVSLTDHLDLVNTPEGLAETLAGLGFPVNVGGQKDVIVDITRFMEMLSALG